MEGGVARGKMEGKDEEGVAGVGEYGEGEDVGW